MNLKIAVLEDKENDYRILESALKIWSEGSGNRIELFWYQTGNEMLKSFEQDGFDILFSDIELEENETGLTFCGRLRELGYSGEIIFLTAFREYVFRGYDVRALHYLLNQSHRKPYPDAWTNILQSMQVIFITSIKKMILLKSDIMI